MSIESAQAAEMLNRVQYVFLRKIWEPRDNSLQLILDEAITQNKPAQPDPSLLPELQKLMQGGRPIEITAESKAFEFQWTRYVAYLVTEEMAASCGNYENEIYSGKVLRLYESSHFLEHLARDTGGHETAILHYKIVCLNHVIDVASYKPPAIRLVAPLYRM